MIIINYLHPDHNEMLGEIDLADYLILLQSYDGEELSNKIMDGMLIIERGDPHLCEDADEPDVFVSHAGLVHGIDTATILLKDLRAAKCIN